MKTKEDIRIAFSVSGATIANWVKTGLIPDGKSFSNIGYNQIVHDINLSGKLTSRANRFHSQQDIPGINAVLKSENKTLLNQLLQLFNKLNADKSLSMLALCLSALEQKKLIALSYPSKSSKTFKISAKNAAFSTFLSEWAATRKVDELANILHETAQFKLPENETDFLGAVYESMRNLGEKSRLGAFFTPPSLVNDLNITSCAKVLDPCSGTGTILLSIIDPLQPPKEIHLRDVDELALRIAKVNFALFFNSTNVFISISCENALSWNCNKKFDFIVTNPPWGADFDELTRTEISRHHPEFKNADSFDIILNHAIEKLSAKGKLVFILPESFLYVNAHLAARRKVFKTVAAIDIRFFGNAFKEVQSKVIRLELDKSKKSFFIVCRNNHCIELSAELLEKNNFRPPAINSLAEMQLLKKLLSKSSGRLSSCTFGLGIVTGNNKKHLLDDKLIGTEAIFTGKELHPFAFSDARKFILFNPKQLQQCAPKGLYSNPKICYRFISDKLQMVADNKGVLVLNSVNFFIPPAKYNLKALAAFFNSPICSFLYQRLFNSVKVLRSHLENMPLPDAYFDNESALEQLYKSAENGNDVKQELHKLTCLIFGIDEKEFDIVNIQYSS